MEDINNALLLKWAWRFKTGGNCLWKKVIIGCHGFSRKWSLLPCTDSASGCWKQIVKIGNKIIWNGRSLGSYFAATVGNGSSVCFWLDTWLGEEPLRLTYPNLFRLESNKWAVISDRLHVINGLKSLHWSWKSAPFSAAENNDLFGLLSDIYDFPLEGGSDTWKWVPSTSGTFSVCSARRLLSQSFSPPQASLMKWKSWTPLKCKVLVWRALLNRLPTATELIKRGMNIQNSCVMCNSDSETVTHLFTGCFYAAEIWSRIESWCSLPPMIVFDVEDLMKIASSQPFPKHAKYILRGIFYTTLWTVWMERNDRVFQDRRRRAPEVFESIKMTSYFWFKNRSNVNNLDWKDWCTYPLASM